MLCLLGGRVVREYGTTDDCWMCVVASPPAMVPERGGAGEDEDEDEEEDVLRGAARAAGAGGGGGGGAGPGGRGRGGGRARGSRQNKFCTEQQSSFLQYLYLCHIVQNDQSTWKKLRSKDELISSPL